MIALLLPLAAFLSLPLFLQPPTPPAETAPPTKPTSTIRGRVLTASDAPVKSACVLLCDAASGLPLIRATMAPFDTSHEAAESLGKDAAFDLTDDAGAFSFDAVPAGSYRLIAQSWPEPRDESAPLGPISDLLAVNGEVIDLHGVATFTIEPPTNGAAASVPREITIRPLGSATLRIDQKTGNNETLLVISTAPTRADPILAHAGWSGPFAQNMIGANRMPYGDTTIRGLPTGPIHVAMLAADNVPGYAAGSFNIEADAAKTTDPVAIRIPFVAPWSDGMNSPPPALERLTDEFIALKPNSYVGVLELLKSQGIALDPPEGARWGWIDACIPHLDKQVTVPSGTSHRAADVMAAAAYAALRQALATSGRTLNPYRGVEILPSGTRSKP
ncbi:MAG: carboxypeptidase regulatory-like domain-containing protein [Phycisphaerales bacterium]|nr:carboxypeptidase regulatory-like domain-containing protein [Phycisphaerales bacterium]